MNALVPQERIRQRNDLEEQILEAMHEAEKLIITKSRREFITTVERKYGPGVADRIRKEL